MEHWIYLNIYYTVSCRYKYKPFIEKQAAILNLWLTLIAYNLQIV